MHAMYNGATRVTKNFKINKSSGVRELKTPWMTSRKLIKDFFDADRSILMNTCETGEAFVTHSISRNHKAVRAQVSRPRLCTHAFIARALARDFATPVEQLRLPPSVLVTLVVTLWGNVSAIVSRIHPLNFPEKEGQLPPLPHPPLATPLQIDNPVVDNCMRKQLSFTLN